MEEVCDQGERDEEKEKEEKRRRKGTRETDENIINAEAQLACSCLKTSGRTKPAQPKLLKKDCSLSVCP